MTSMLFLLFMFNYSGNVAPNVQDETVKEDKQEKNLKEKLEELEKQIKELKQEQEEQKKKETEKKHQWEQIKTTVSEHLGGLQFSGFFDVQAEEHNRNPNTFSLGDFEFDMEHPVGDHFQVGAALVFNEEGTELAVGFIDYHLYGGSIMARGPVFMDKGFHIQVGKFDIPFGNDWQFYASSDRSTITAPLTTEAVLDGGFNDTGLRILQATPMFNYTVYMLKGVGEGNSYGGRVGLTPLRNPFSFKQTTSLSLEMGFSYLYDVDANRNREESSWCIDLLAEYEKVLLQAEYVDRENPLEAWKANGSQATISYHFLELDIMSVSGILRFDRYDRDYNAEPSITGELENRWSMALNFDFQEVSALKLEYRRFQETDHSEFQAQLVVRF